MRSSNNPDSPDAVLIGKIAGAHGIHGAVKVISYAESVEAFAPDGMLFLMDPNGTGQTQRVRWAKPYKNGMLMSFEGVSDRDTAQSLIGWTIHLPKTALEKLDADTYYWFELIGLAVYEGSVYLGRITSILPTGSNDVYVVKNPERGSTYEVLVPALSSVVETVDLDNGKMIVCLPEGLGPDVAPST